ncbi:MAG: alpha/beta hydrolase [Cytophagales bacterium]|nr:alpha/beta hydrolase [Cytophagales bacterium]
MKTSKFDPFIKRTNVRDIKFVFRALNIIFRLGELFHQRAVSDFVRKRFFTPAAKPLTKPQKSWIGKATPYKVKCRGKELAVWKVGNGPSILFVHGWNGRGVQFQRFFQPAMEAGFSVIFFDAPAHGSSDGDMTNYMEITESLEHIFSHETGKNIVGVIAHSLGTSAIINHLTRQHADVPLVLVAAALRLMELLFVNFQSHGVPKRTYLKLLDEIEEEFRIPLETQNPIDLIHNLKNQILIIHDVTDKTTPIGPSRVIADTLDNVRLMETEGLGHSQLLKDKSVILGALDFLKKNQVIRGNELIAV